MNRIVFAVGLTMLVFGVPVLAQVQSEGVEQELIRLETEWGDAILKRDVTTLDKLLADELVMIADGIVMTKAELLEYVKSYTQEYTSVVFDEWKVRVYGDAAVVIALTTVKMKSEGKDVTSQSRFTDTWVKRDGRWQCVAAHNSTVVQK